MGSMMVVCCGKIDKKPVVVNDEIVIRPMMNSIYTIDHRFGDASVGIKFMNIIKAYLDSPETFSIDKFPQTPAYNNPDYAAKKAQ